MPGQDTNPADRSSDMNVELDNCWENGRPSSSPSTVNRESDAQEEPTSNTTNDNSFQLCQNTQLEDSSDWSRRSPSTSAASCIRQTHAHDEPGPSSSTSADNHTFLNRIYGGSSDSGSESDDAQVNCPVCFVSLINREVATPDSCQHYFCCPCLKQWSKTVTTCPVDRRKFKLILVRSNIGGQVVRVDPVDPVTVQSFSDNEDDPTYCQVCHSRDREDRMLLCDYCDSGFHLECLNPPLDEVPDGDWFCSRCQLLDTRNTEQNQGRVTWVRVPAFPVGLGGRRVQCVRVPSLNQQVEEVINVSSDDDSEIEETFTRSGRRVRRQSVSSNSDSASTQKITPVRKRPAGPTRSARKRGTGRTPSPRGEGSFSHTRRRRQQQRNISESSVHTVEDSDEDGDVQIVRKSGRSRLAENLGLVPCRRSHSSNTTHAPAPAPASSLNRQRISAGIPTLHLFGNDSLDYFSDGSDGENGNEGGGSSRVLCHRSRSSPTAARRLAARKLSQSLMSSTPRPNVNLNPRPSTSRDTSSSSHHNLLDSIMESQGLWHSRNTTVSLRRDGTITIKKASEMNRPNEARSSSNDGPSSSTVTESLGRSEDRIRRSSNPQDLSSGLFSRRDAVRGERVADIGSNIFTSRAGSSRSLNNVGQQRYGNNRLPWETHTSNRINVRNSQTRVSQVPLYPGNSSNSRSPGSSGSYHHNKDSQYERSSSSSYQYSGHMYSSSHLSGFDSDRGHLGYTGYLGPENSSTSDLPNSGRFNLLPQFPIRRTHPHPSTSLSASSTDERQLEEADFLDDPDISSGKSSNERDSKKNTYRKVTEDDDLDIYSDIEVSSAGGQTCASEHEDNERNYDVLPPPPEPSALLIGLGEQDSSDSETNDSLVIDIRPNQDDHTHKDNVTKSPDESEKYDPAVPCDDSDDDEPLVCQSTQREDIPLPPCPPSLDKADVSTSNASYLKSPTYGELSKQCSVHVTEAVTEAVKEVINSTLQSSSASDNKALASGDEDDDEGECPNFSIYSADSMDIARKATEIPEENSDALEKSDPVIVITDQDKVEDEKCEAKSDILEMPIEPSTDHNNQESRDDDEQMDELGSISEIQHEPLENNDDVIEQLSKSLQCSSRSSSSCSSSSSSCCSSSSSSSGSSSSSSTDGSSLSQNTSCEEPHKSAKPEEKDMKAVAVEKIADQMIVTAVQPVTSVASENHEKSAITDETSTKQHEVVKLDQSGETENLVVGAASAVPAVSSNNAAGTQDEGALSLDNTVQSLNSSLPAATPVGLEGLDTETISETEEAINFDDDMSHDETSILSEEDGEISPQKKRKKATDEVKDSSKADNSLPAEKPLLEKDLSPAETVDYEEGEIVDERPRLSDVTSKDKTLDKDKRLESSEIRSADEAEMSECSVHIGIEEEKKKKKKKSSDRDRAELGANDDEDTAKGKGSTVDESISWKKPSKGTKERNYRDSKSTKPTDKGKDGNRKESEEKESPKKEKKKKEKRKDMERYDVRKIVSDKKRKRKDEFGRDLSRDRSYSRSRSRSKSRGKSRDRSPSLSRTKTNRTKGRSSPRSRHRSRSRSRSRSYRSRSRSKNKSTTKLKDRNRKSRSKERQRKVSRDRSRSRNRRSRSRSGSRVRNRSRSRSIHKSREGKDRSRATIRQKRPPKNRRSWSRTWTPSWSRSRSRSQSVSCSSYSRSPSPSARRYNRSYSRSFSRSWSRERHERVPLMEKKTNTVVKPPKKLTVIVNNSKEDSERQRKKDKKKKDSRKSKDQSGAEKRKKRKEKSPVPSKEVFTSGDNILVSVNFNKSNKGPGAKDAAVAAAAAVTSASISALPKDSSKRKQRDDTFDVGRETTKKSRKDKSGKDKTSKALNSNTPNTDKTQKLDKRSKRAKGDKRLAALLRQKPVAIIDLDQSPFREQTPSPRDFIVLSDSDDAQRDKETEMEDGIMTRMMHQEILSPQNSLKMSATARTPESQSPVMSSVSNYLNTSTGPKTPPEPQIKFSIAAKPQLRSISNPLREEDDDLLAEDTVLDESDRQVDEDLDSDIIHKGPNTPPEPRGPTTPCSPPISPDAYDPFDPTKSGTPSPVREEVNIDELQSPSGTPCEEVMQHSVGVTDSPMQSDLDDTAKKTLEISSEIPLIQSCDNLRDDVTLTPDRTKPLTVIETMLGTSPSNVDESVVGTSQHQLQVEVSPSEPGEKSSTLSVTMIVPMNSDITPLSPEIKIIPMTVQQQKLLKQNILQQPVTSTPTHCSTPSNHANLPTSIASTPISPLTSTPVSRSNVFSTPITITVPQLSSHHLPHHLPSSPVTSQQRTVGIKTVTEKVTAISYVKSVAQRPTGQQNGEQKEQIQDTSTEVVDMDLDSPYSPGSSEGDDLFEPPSETVKPTAAYPPMNTRPTQTPQKTLRQSLPALGNTQSKPPDKFDALFGMSPARNKGSAKMGKMKTHHGKAGKMKTKLGKGSKKEIQIKMDEDQLQILDDLPSSAVELQVKDKFLKKLNRQERVVEEVKLSLKPYYTSKKINKEEYKEILRRSVPKICHNRSGEINPKKISALVDAYVLKYRYIKKKQLGSQRKQSKPQKTTMWS